MDEMLMKVLICFAAYSLFGWLILFAGLKTRKEKRLREALERNRTAGRIAEYVKREKSLSRGSVSILWIPVIEFTVYQQTYRLEYGNPMDREKWPAGTAVTVGYDGSDPRRFHLEEDPVYQNGGLNAVRIGVIWILIALGASVTLAVLVGGESLSGLWDKFLRLFRR